MLIEGKGEDIDEAEDEDESKEEEEPLKKKGKVTITKPPKPSTAMFTRWSKKKVDKDSGDIIFSWPPPTFKDRLKAFRGGVGMANFKLSNMKLEQR